MNLKALQPSFSGGELSPSLYSRVDLAKYSTGLRTALNFIIHPSGGASNRPGTQFIAAAKNAAKKSRLIPFEFSLEQAYVLEFAEHSIRVFKDGALLTLENSPANFNPTATYAEGAYVAVGYFMKATKAANHASLFFHTTQETYPELVGALKLRITTDGTAVLKAHVVSDTLTITFSSDDAHNTAAAIQAQVRALGVSGFIDYSLFSITENSEFNADRTYFAGAATYVYANSTVVKPYRATTAVTGNAANMSVFPAVTWANTSPSEWAQTDIFEIVTPYAEADLPEIKVAQSADVLYIVHPDHAPRMLVRYGVDDWDLELYDFKNGPFMNSNAVETNTLTVSAKTGTSKTLTAAAVTFDTSSPSLHIGSLWRVQHDLAGQSVTAALASVTETGSIQCGKTWRIITHGNWHGTIEVQKSLDGGTTWKAVRQFSSSMNGGATGDNNVNTYGDLGEPCLVRVAMTAFTAGTCNMDLTTDAYTHTGVVKITGVTDNKTATCDILTAVGDTTATWLWAEGSWSNYRGWPSSVVFFLDRLCFACAGLESQNIWMSQSGVYDDFGRGDPLVDSDGITVTLSARKMNGIRNLVALNTILAFTSSTEWSIGPGSDGVLSPTSIQVRCQGYRGSAVADPLVIGNRGLFFQPMGAILRDFGYDFSSDGYTGDDLTVFSNHLFDNHNVVEMAYAQEPDSLVWCVRDDGSMLAMTYMKEQEVLAWTRHTTDGEFESVCSIPGNGFNEVWVVVKRTINGATVRYIERLAQRMTSTDVKDQYFVDAGITYSGAEATEITGLDHLEGEEVAVLADGDVVNDLTVSGGKITLPAAAAKVHVGLPYNSDFETLDIELNLNTGTTQGSKMKLSKVLMRFQNSRGGLLGADFTEATMDAVNNERTDELLDEPINIKNVDFEQLMGNSGYSEAGRVCYRQKDPLPVTILAVIPTVNIGG